MKPRIYRLFRNDNDAGPYKYVVRFCCGELQKDKRASVVLDGVRSNDYALLLFDDKATKFCPHCGAQWRFSDKEYGRAYGGPYGIAIRNEVPVDLQAWP